MNGGVLFDLDETLLDRTASISDYARRLRDRQTCLEDAGWLASA